MKNYFNPAAAVIDFRIKVNVGVADKTGWEFSDYYENCRIPEMDDMGWEVISLEDYEDAKKRIQDEETITIRIIGEANNPKVDFYYGDGDGGAEDTGDNKQTIEDVIDWLDTGSFIDYKDYSVDDNNRYMPAFAQFATMKEDEIGGFLVGKEIIKLYI